MYEIRSSAGLIWHPRRDRNDHAVMAANVALELNRAGSMTFRLPPSHPAFDLLPALSSECWLLQDGEELFRGRVLYSDRDIRNCKEIVCEGLLNVLNDECLRPEDLSGSGRYSGSAAGLINKLCTAYNSRQTGAVPFVRGTVDNFGTVVCEATDYPQIGDFLQDVISAYGGYVSVRRVNGQNVIDYTVSSGSAGEQAIRFGENLLDLQEHVSGEDVYTVVIPLGKDQGENAGRLTIKQAANSGGRDYIENAAAVAALGVRIARVVTFDEIDDPDELYAAGVSVFSQGGGLMTGLTLSAADLRDGGVETDNLRLGKIHRVQSIPHGIDTNMPLTKMDVDLMRPDEANYTFGIRTMSLTDQVAHVY